LARWTKKQKQEVLAQAEATTIREAAEKFGVPEGTIKRWRSEQRKTEPNQKNEPKPNRTKKQNVVKKQDKTVEETEEKNPKLTEMQSLFCLYYIKSFNATQAAIKAGYSKNTAHVIGHENLRKPKIAEEIKRLKGSMTEELFLDAMDVLKKWIQIAFSDITDYVKFGQKEVQVMGPFGPLVDKEGDPVTKIVNYVSFNESSMVDGTIIKEVKQGKDGVSIKFEDKLKALEKLSEYFDLFPDKFKQKIEEEKIQLTKEKLQLEKAKIMGDPEETEDDGFIDALSQKVGEAWDGYSDEEES